jgi:hypothetical protein
MSRSTIPRGMRALLLVASLGAVQACSEEPSAPAGSVTVTLAPTSSSIAQGGSTTNTVTVLGGGGFVATPTITVTGAPAGITSSVTNLVTTNGTSTATVTLNASMAVTPGVYPISVVASGPGVSARAAVYTLTVTGGSFTTAFTPSTLSVAQGSSGTRDVTITRTNLTGNIGLAVTGMPAGVTATLSPTSTTGTTSTLTVTAASNAALGTANLVLTGTATGAANQTSTLALTITPP